MKLFHNQKLQNWSITAIFITIINITNTQYTYYFWFKSFTDLAFSALKVLAGCPEMHLA